MSTSIQNLIARERAGYGGPRFNVDPSLYDALPTYTVPEDTSWTTRQVPQPVMPVMFQPTGQQQQDESGGWADVLGALGGGILSRVLDRRSQRTPISHQSAPHIDEPIIQPHAYQGTGLGSPVLNHDGELADSCAA